MTPNQLSKGLEEKITGLLASLAVLNENVMNLTKLSEKHDAVLYGRDDAGGVISRMNAASQKQNEHDATLERLETSCENMVKFMESQVKINESQTATNLTLNRVIYGLAGVVFLILLLIGVADISALHNLLAGVKIP